MDSEVTRNEILNFTIGEVIAKKYKLVSSDGKSDGHPVPLGEGGSGVVYKAKQSLHADITVYRAIKFYVFRDNIAQMTPHKNTGPISFTSFKDEMVNLSRLNHQNVLKVIEAGFWTSPTNHQVPFLITDFIEGPTLAQAIVSGRLDEVFKQQPHILIDLILQICRGVCHLHSRGFFHFDIAPKNIFLQGAYPEYHLVIGDLGVGRTIPKNVGNAEDKVFIAGTKDYCPEEYQSYLYTEVPLSLLFKLQPRWDLFCIAKISVELVRILSRNVEPHPAWLDALTGLLLDICQVDANFKTVSQLEKRVYLLHPTQHMVYGVEELSENAPKTRRSLLAVEGVITSPRIRALIEHPKFLRLKRVPQLIMSSKMLHGGNHNRYEHSLGIYQNARRYLLALLNDYEFLMLFNPEHIELALVAALLSNITRFPFSSIIHEIHSKDKNLYNDFTRSNLLDELMNKSEDGKSSLKGVIEKHFPSIDIDTLSDILTGQAPNQYPTIKFIKTLLNSSIDVRVVDYLRRDSCHIGISRGDTFDLGDLLPYLKFKNRQLVIRSKGLPVIEQIITFRYWLFNRIYWNQPNRTMIAMVRAILYILHQEMPEFPSLLRAKVLTGSEDSLLECFYNAAKEKRIQRIKELCEFLYRDRPPSLRNCFSLIAQMPGTPNLRH